MLSRHRHLIYCNYLEKEIRRLDHLLPVVQCFFGGQRDLEPERSGRTGVFAIEYDGSWAT